MYLTISSIKDFLLCPFKFKLSHIDRLQKKVPKAILAFGTTIHNSIATYYVEKKMPKDTFKAIWQEEAGKEYEYNGDTHEVLLEQGEKILEQWYSASETPHEATSVEKQRYIEIANQVPFWSTIDFTGEDGDLLLDWKTSSAKYPESKVKLDLQLTAYSYVLAETEKMPAKVGFGVFIKKKTPEIQYLFSVRTKEDLKNFEKITLKVWQDVQNEVFFKTPGMQCSWCDYLPICTDEPEAEKQFITVPPRY